MITVHCSMLGSSHLLSQLIFIAALCRDNGCFHFSSGGIESHTSDVGMSASSLGQTAENHMVFKAKSINISHTRWWDWILVV